MMALSNRDGALVSYLASSGDSVVSVVQSDSNTKTSFIVGGLWYIRIVV